MKFYISSEVQYLSEDLLKKEKIFFLQQGTEKKKFERKRALKYRKIVCACTDSGFKRQSCTGDDKFFKSGFPNSVWI